MLQQKTLAIKQQHIAERNATLAKQRLENMLDVVDVGNLAVIIKALQYEYSGTITNSSGIIIELEKNTVVYSNIEDYLK